jgi:hypothetical protein
VVDYVGRNTHRVAISNHRIVDIEGGEVKFTWRDYRNNNQQKTMTLSADQFIERFLLHVLPSGFHRIRYYGFLANPIAKRSWSSAANFSACPTHEKGLLTPQRWRTTVIDTRDSRAVLCGNAPFAIAAT